MSESIQLTADAIRQLKIQGARNVAIAGIKATRNLAIETRARSKKDFVAELMSAKKTLFESRETEPLLRNAIKLIVKKVESSPEKSIAKLKRTVQLTSGEFLKNLDASGLKIADIGARRIRNNSVVFTHCHSSTVTNVLKKAKDEGKDFEAIVTETRPMFQGRITAKEMLSSGINTTLIVDSAARFFMNQVDMVLVGADAITSEGNAINKIGTSTVALVAHEARTPFYVVTELLKYDVTTEHGDYEKIEERPSSEIWKSAPKNLLVKNPAFDVTRRDFIHGIICEEGIISPHSVNEVIHRVYPWIFE